MVKQGKNSDALAKVLAYQGRVSSGKKNVAELRRVITEKEQELEALQRFTTVLPELLERQEDLLAEIALGGTAQQELNQVTEQIDSERKKLDEHAASLAKVSTTAKPALVGLRRMLAAAELELSELKTSKPEILSEFIKNEAEQLAVSYVDSAVNLVQKLTQLRALGSLIRQYGGNIFNNYSGGNVDVPIFNLKACLDAVHKTIPGRIEAVINAAGQDLTPIMSSEMDRFKEMGIDF